MMAFAVPENCLAQDNTSAGQPHKHTRLGRWFARATGFLHLHKSSVPRQAHAPTPRRPQAQAAAVLLTQIPRSTHSKLLKLPIGIVRESPDASIGTKQKNRFFALRYGSMLISTKQPVLVQCDQTSIAISKGVVALISYRGGILKVLNLYESRGNSIMAIVGGTSRKLCAGQEIIATNNYDKLGLSMAFDGVYRRCVHTFSLPDGQQLATSEFASVSLIKHDPILADLRASKAKEDKQIYKKVLKMSACLTIATASHGFYLPISYEPLSKPQQPAVMVAGK
jgi:hypothetical protein